MASIKKFYEEIPEEDSTPEIELDEERIINELLFRTLNDFALIDPNKNSWCERVWREARDWIFGEAKPLKQDDPRLDNFTIDRVCEVLGRGSKRRIRDVALFMRRFRLDCSMFAKIWWDENENKNKTFEEQDFFSEFGPDQGAFERTEGQSEGAVPSSEIRDKEPPWADDRPKVRVRRVAKLVVKRHDRRPGRKEIHRKLFVKPNRRVSKRIRVTRRKHNE